MNLFNDYKVKIQSSLIKLQKEKKISLPNKNFNFTVELPPKNQDSHISCNVAMVLSKHNKKDPFDLAKDLSNFFCTEASILISAHHVINPWIEGKHGEDCVEEFVSAIEQATGEAVEQALEDELAAAIDAAVAEAVEQGISRAAVEAGLAAYLQALASGQSEQQAYDAGCAAAGQDSGC